MVASLTYRTADGTRWGGGNGSDLSAAQIDLNFWTLYEAVAAIQADPSAGVGIDYITQTGGNLLYITLTNHSVLGPFTIPTAQWNPRGAWAATTVYAAYDLVTNGGDLYLVLLAHTSAGTFSAGATDGLGHNLYSLLLASPSNALPAGGNPAQKLLKTDAGDYDTEWADDRVRLALFVEGQPLPGETLLLYGVVDDMTLPANLTGSKFYNLTTATADTTYTINKNGNPIGTITFNGSGISVTFATAVTFVFGDLITFVAPATPDTTHAGISFTFVAILT